MKTCCESESRCSLKHHRDVATCDECGALLLAYESDVDFERTLEELDAHGVDYERTTIGKLKVIAKTRATTPSTPSGPPLA